MSRAWVFQANPDNYDIDAALHRLDRIWWRVPRYTSEVHAGDVAVLWRSGSDAGVVGVGRIASEPQIRAIDPDERDLVRAPDEVIDDTTRVLILVRPCQVVPK